MHRTGRIKLLERRERILFSTAPYIYLLLIM